MIRERTKEMRSLEKVMTGFARRSAQRLSAEQRAPAPPKLRPLTGPFTFPPPLAFGDAHLGRGELCRRLICQLRTKLFLATRCQLLCCCRLGRGLMLRDIP